MGGELRWIRPIDVEPGHWKRQLPTKTLKLAAGREVEPLREHLAAHPDDLNRRGNHGRTLIWEAARRGRTQTVDFLIASGAAVNVPGAYQNETYVQVTPLCVALARGDHELAERLRPLSELDHFRASFLGERSDRVFASLDEEDPFDEIYFMTPIVFAAAGGHVALVGEMIGAGALVGPYTNQLVLLALRRRNLDLLDVIFDGGARAELVDGSLFVAAPDAAMVRALLDRGVDPNAPGQNGVPPLVYCARGDKGANVEKLRALLEHGADPNAADDDGHSALDHATKHRAREAIDLLRAFGA